MCGAAMGGPRRRRISEIYSWAARKRVWIARETPVSGRRIGRSRNNGAGRTRTSTLVVAPRARTGRLNLLFFVEALKKH